MITPTQEKLVNRVVNDQTQINKVRTRLLVMMAEGEDVSPESLNLFFELGWDLKRVKFEVERMKSTIQHTRRAGTAEDREQAAAKLEEIRERNEKTLAGIEDEIRKLQSKSKALREEEQQAARELKEMEQSFKVSRERAPEWLKQQHQRELQNLNASSDRKELNEAEHAVRWLDHFEQMKVDDPGVILRFLESNYPDLVVMRKHAGNNVPHYHIETFNKLRKELLATRPDREARLAKAQETYNELRASVDAILDQYIASVMEEIK